ncbi:tetratricopeptide repeat protein, partial [Saprospiraceae bacterium]|nr:tetratricopeptide repeat protein [Saprospiraceae bacterium]
MCCWVLSLTAQNNNINPKSMAYDMPEYQQAKEHLDNRQYPEAEILIVKILKKLEEADRTEDYIEMLNLHAKSMMHQWKTDESLEVYHKMKSLAKDNNLNELHSNAIQALAVTYRFKDSFDIEEKLILEGMKLKGLHQNDYSNYYLAYGEIWNRKNNIDSALHYANIAYNIDIEINDSISLPKTCQVISFIYDHQNNYDQALSYLIEGKSYIQDETNYKHAYFNGDIANVMLSIRNIEKAKYYAEEAVHIARVNNLTSTLSDKLSLLGSIEELQGNYEQALLHYKEALELNKKPKKINSKIQLTRGVIASKLHLGQTVNQQEIDNLVSLKEKTKDENAKSKIDLIQLRYLSNNNISQSEFEKRSKLLFNKFKKN